MARNRRGKMSLYEVMSKARLKPGHGRSLEKIRPEKPEEDEPVTETEVTVGEEDSIVEMPKVSVRWWRKPRVVQFNAGRIEFSIPYPIAIAVFLGLVMVVLIAFRLGQRSYLTSEVTVENPPGNAGGNRVNPTMLTNNTATQNTKTVKPIAKDTGDVGAAKSTGNNVIVLVQYKRTADLAPVQAHFEEYGIATEIVNWGGQYFLITKDRYDNPNTKGTDGYEALQRIVEVGAKYNGKAPEGFETFAPNYFKDAYGMKVN